MIKKFAEIDLHPRTVPNQEMGYVFEELIRKYNEDANETAGDHFTPREVIRLMVNVLFAPDGHILTKRGIAPTIYDPTAGHGYKDVSTLVAFSGTVIDDLDPETTCTEGGMNRGIAGREIPRKFETDEYQVLIAADKFQTGFDQPLLHTMYGDKRLAGIQAVQTLSRLNRTHAGKEDTFVLDFYNERDEVLRAFQDYYEVTTVGEQADPNQMYTLQSQLNGSGAYRLEEVDEFCQVFFKLRKIHTATDHGKINAILDLAVERFKALRDELKTELPEKEWRQAKEEAQDEFRGRLQGFRSLYSRCAVRHSVPSHCAILRHPMDAIPASP